MPLRYTVDWSRRRIHLHAEGKLVPEDYRELFRRYDADDLEGTFDHFCDARGIELSASADDMRSIAGLMGAHAHYLRGCNVIVVGSQASYGMSRMLDALAEPFQVRFAIFDDMDEAEAYLDRESRQPLAPEAGEE